MSISLLFRVLLVAGFFACSCVPGARAQEFGRVEDLINAGVSYHAYARPGEATVQVFVVTGAGSGLYEVGTSTDLGTLLVLSGSLAIAPVERRQKRDVTIKLYRAQAGERIAIYEASLERFMQQPGAYPDLQDGDVVAVEVTQHAARLGWRDALSILSAVGTTMVLYFQLRQYTR